MCLECVHNDIPRISGLRSLVGSWMHVYENIIELKVDIGVAVGG